MSAGYGYFRIEFYTNDGSADADAAKRAFDWCKANYDWFKGGENGTPFLLNGNSFDMNEKCTGGFGLDIKSGDIPDNIDWLADAAKEAKAARLVASIREDFSESSYDSNSYTEKVWIDGEEKDKYKVYEFNSSTNPPYMVDSYGSLYHLDEDGGTYRHLCGKFRNVQTGGIVLGGRLMSSCCRDEDYGEYTGEFDPDSTRLYFDESGDDVSVNLDDINKEEIVSAFWSEVEGWFEDFDCGISESDWTFEGFAGESRSFFEIYGSNPPLEEYEGIEESAGGIAYEFMEKNGIFCYADKSATSITIPDGFTKIGKEAFEDRKSLESVVIPEGITEIGERAFLRCESLSSVEFGGTVAQWEAVKGKQYLLAYIPAKSVKCADGEWQKPVVLVENGVAVKCLDESAASVAIPEGVTEIGEYAFYGCESLSSVSIPSSVTEIGERAFYGCKSLSSVSIPEGITEIGEWAFYDCESLSSVVIPESVTEIGEMAFRDCNISELSHPCLTIKGGFAIKDNAVLYCASQNASITIPEGVTEIGRSAFYDCELLSSVVIPESVTEIGKRAFSGCKSLSSVEFGGTVAQWKAVEKGNYWKDGVPAKSVKCADGDAGM